MRAALCIGGEAPDVKKIYSIIEDVDVIAAADSGFDTLHKAGIEPGFLVGDMDSTEYPDKVKAYPRDKVEIVPRDKEETDTEIALRRLHERGIEDVTLIGGGGGRLDHLLGIVTLFDRDIRPREWYTRSDRVVSIEEKIFLEGLEGLTVSLFPVGKETCRLKSTGLKWPLDKLVWEKGDAGISNLVTEEVLVLEPIEGRAIMVYSFAEEVNTETVSYTASRQPKRRK
ncbi:MAG: thiamine diphosphokinase [Spirochaetaceae bacterium]